MLRYNCYLSSKVYYLFLPLVVGDALWLALVQFSSCAKCPDNFQDVKVVKAPIDRYQTSMSLKLQPAKQNASERHLVLS